MEFSVVIVTYNRINLLKECINCVEKQLFDNIIIVDNASTDGTRNFLKNYVDGRFHIILEDKNGGGAKGFKDGVEYIFKSDIRGWVLLIDDDAMLNLDFLKNIKCAIDKFPSCQAFSGSVLTDGKIDLTHRKHLIKKLTFKETPVPAVEYEKEYFEYDLSSFCGLVFQIELISKIGMPKEQYFIWFDDTEYSLRIRKETTIINVNKALVNHKTYKSAQKDQLNWRGYYGIRNKGDIIRIYGTDIQYFLYRLRVKIAMCRNLLLSFISSNKNYKFNYNLYKNALRDMKEGHLGINQLFMP